MSFPKLKILVVTGIFPPDSGGPASYVPMISKSLSEHGHEIVSIITLSDSISHRDKEYKFQIKRILRSQKRFIRLIKTIYTIRELARRSDVIFLNGLVFEGIIATKILLNKPVVTKVVGDLIWEHYQHKNRNGVSIDDFQKKFTTTKNYFLKKLQGWYTKKSDLIITPSHYLSNIVHEWGISKNKISVIYNAIESDSNSLEEPSEIQPIYDVICVGRLVPFKKIDSIIHVCQKNEWRLLVVGDGPKITELKSLVNSSAHKKNITFFGEASKNEVPYLMKQSRIFVLNSTYEGLPHVILEAKQAKVPVIATRVGGTPEVIDNNINGILISSEHEQELENAIRKLLNSAELRRTLVLNSTEQLKSNFNWGTLVNQTENTLHSAVKTFYEG